MKKQMKKLTIWFTVCTAAILMAACNNDEDDVRYEEEVIVNPVTGITINAGGDGIVLADVGATATVSVAATPSNAGNIERINYRFNSGNASIFTVDNSGKITATGTGETILSVVAGNYANLTATCKVTVVGKRVASVTIAGAGKDIALTCDPYSSSTTTAYPRYELFPHITVEPADASVKMLKYSSSDQKIAFVNGDGQIVAKGLGIATIRVEAIDGSGKYDESTVRVSEYRQGFLDRSGWEITSSPTASFTPDGTEDVYGGPIGNLIDDNSEDTRVGLLKAAAGGPSDGIIYFAIDMGSEQNFNYFYWEGGWTNGSGSVNNNVKANRATFYGSNESITGPYTVLRYNSSREYYSISTGIYSATTTLTNTYKYRYIRVVLNPYSTSIANNAIGVLWRDFKLGYRELSEP
jgi:hypothetical protein